MAERMIPDQSVRAEREQRGDGLCSPLASRAGDTLVGREELRAGARPGEAWVGEGSRREESPTSKAPGAKRRVESRRGKRAQRAARPKLHIDDGCMGGGGSIGYFEKSYTTERNNLYDNTGIDGTIDQNDPGNHGLDLSRHGLFYYSVMAAYPTEAHSNSLGVSNVMGPRSMVFSQNVLDKTSSTTKWAMNWIHELGHGLGLGHPADNDNPSNIYTSMYQGLHNIVNYGTNSNARDYTDDPIPNGDEWQYVSDHLGEGLS